MPNPDAKPEPVNLPTDVIPLIAFFLDKKTLLAFALVSKCFRDLIRSRILPDDYAKLINHSIQTLDGQEAIVLIQKLAQIVMHVELETARLNRIADILVLQLKEDNKMADDFGVLLKEKYAHASQALISMLAKHNTINHDQNNLNLLLKKSTHSLFDDFFAASPYRFAQLRYILNDKNTPILEESDTEYTSFIEMLLKNIQTKTNPNENDDQQEVGAAQLLATLNNNEKTPADKIDALIEWAHNGNRRFGMFQPTSKLYQTIENTLESYCQKQP